MKEIKAKTSSFNWKNGDRNMNVHHLSVHWNHETFKSQMYGSTHSYIYIGSTYTLANWTKKVLPHETHRSIPKHTFKRKKKWFFNKLSKWFVSVFFCSSVVVVIFILLAGSAQTYGVLLTYTLAYSHTRNKTIDTSTHYTYIFAWNEMISSSVCFEMSFRFVQKYGWYYLCRCLTNIQ